MSEKLPAGFVDLHTAYSTVDKEQNIIGVVVDFLPGAPTRGTDWQMSFSLQDASLMGSFTGNFGLRVKWFGRESALPKIQALGDVVVLRHIKCKPYNGVPMYVSSYSTECCVFPSGAIPDPHYKEAYAGERRIEHFATPLRASPPTLAEQFYVISLRQWYLNNQSLFASTAKIPKAPATMTTAPPASRAAPRPRTGAPAGAPLGPSPVRDRFSLIKDVKDRDFKDIVGEVIKIFPSSYGTLEVYITDYTTNNLMWEYMTPELDAETSGGGIDGDEYGYTIGNHKKKWPGPYGKMTLQVKMWSPHSYWTQSNINEGDFVFLRNVHIKFKEGKLEGALHEDQGYPEQIDVRKVRSDDPRVEMILHRKEEYWRQRNPLKPGNGANAVGVKLTKAQRRKQKRNPSLKKPQRQVESGQNERSDGESPTRALAVAKPNQHIRCDHDHIPISPVSKIINNEHLLGKTPSGVERKLPFINAKHRARVRAVDFFPPNLEDFAQCLDDPSYNDCPSEGEEEEDTFMTTESQQPKRWEWAFYLLVEDGKPPPGGEEPARLKLLVAADDAERLLKLDATDLRNDPTNLDALREKLFILWGNLEELKSGGATLPPSKSGTTIVSSNAFECCIQEYGVPVPRTDDGGAPPTEYLRMHRMFGTTIS